jgi:hypothetical protein
VKAIAIAIAFAATALAVGTTPASATTNECNGLQTCVPVAGPWVIIPVAGGTSRPHVEYQLSCPAGFVVGGIDVELSDRAIDIAFLGRPGSPVNPGITTQRAAVFVATYVGTGAVVASFRPHLGCIPARGGGTRVPTVVRAPPISGPVVRRSREVRLLPGRRQVIGQGCAAKERLVGSSDAVGFYTSTPPPPRLVSAVALGARRVRGAKVQVVARASAALRGERAVVQVGADCAGGT